MTDLLFETPWWFPTFFIMAGIFIWWVGNRSQNKRNMQVGMLVALLGLTIAMVSYLVDTPKEKAVKRTYALAAAAEHHDWPAFQSLLDKPTNVYGLVGPEEITTAAKTVVEQYGLSSVRITGLEAQQSGSVIKVALRAITDIGGQSTVSDWQLQFQNLGEGWMLYSVTAVSNEQFNEQEIKNRLLHP